MSNDPVNLASLLQQHLPPELLTLLRSVGEHAHSQGQNLYLVGGTVRDIFLGRPSLDIDLVVEGDALQLASLIAQKEGGEALLHRQFGTAKFRRGKLSIDMVTARSETYARPGALPAVRPGSIQDDLFRRDFTINAMALSLVPTHFGELIDPYQGRKDLDQRLIRILHPKSFIDDATRILRALRYEQRLDFHLEPFTEQLLRRDKAMLKTISGDRLRQELLLILQEERPEKVLRRAAQLAVLQEIHPALRGNGWLEEKFSQARQQGKASLPALYLLLLVYSFSPEESESFIQGLKLPRDMAKGMRDTLNLKTNVSALPQLSPSSLYHLLQSYSPQAIRAVALAVDLEEVCQALELYLSKLRYIRPSLDGEALQKMGIPSGPRIGEILRALQDARLEGKVTTRDEEEELAQQWLGK